MKKKKMLSWCNESAEIKDVEAVWGSIIIASVQEKDVNEDGFPDYDIYGYELDADVSAITVNQCEATKPYVWAIKDVSQDNCRWVLHNVQEGIIENSWTALAEFVFSKHILGWLFICNKKNLDRPRYSST